MCLIKSMDKNKPTGHFYWEHLARSLWTFLLFRPVIFGVIDSTRGLERSYCLHIVLPKVLDCTNICCGVHESRLRLVDNFSITYCHSIY